MLRFGGILPEDLTVLAERSTILVSCKSIDKMMHPIDWKEIAYTLGAIKEAGEIGSDALAREAIELLVGKENIRQAVDYYIEGKPGSELARNVLREIRPWGAMNYCYEIFISDAKVERRRLAVELLRVVADRRVIPWIEEFLLDDDPIIRQWGFGVVDQLLWKKLVKEDEVAHLFPIAEKDPYLSEHIDFVKEFLETERKRKRILSDYFRRQTS